jgi:hypothetical protein
MPGPPPQPAPPPLPGPDEEDVPSPQPVNTEPQPAESTEQPVSLTTFPAGQDVTLMILFDGSAQRMQWLEQHGFTVNSMALSFDEIRAAILSRREQAGIREEVAADLVTA